MDLSLETVPVVLKSELRKSLKVLVKAQIARPTSSSRVSGSSTPSPGICISSKFPAMLVQLARSPHEENLGSRLLGYFPNLISDFILGG